MEVYTLGVWRVMAGKESEFVEAWKALGDRFRSLHHPPGQVSRGSQDDVSGAVLPDGRRRPSLRNIMRAKLRRTVASHGRSGCPGPGGEVRTAA